ncbi:MULTISPECIES: glycosyltransferase family 2 protein [unclassified Campylobacter]|uniref:glycosyltransferase family 2 protein n=1 Tax=unclassified Campylobacter TaxID=2593542 RepID=UPI0022E9F420|nr:MULTISPECIES: glycosyltransferase family 2 protein [unclassified Campylobacter]MDA3062015.1 glycosyltransferase family 2 protein [Campylobacter sp. JMF_14 EL1]MDA3072880.1 glycosyltransferase family 2 protein [Campylobacter sp. JMF_10 EL2]
MKSYIVSIIIPVYNVEKYIVKCATTLFEQDFDSIEYIFVNDCSPDNSMQVLQSVIEKYPNRKNDIKIINKPQNEGLGQARKTGFESATGEYILHIDSDDWVEFDMVSSMYKKAKEDDADIVVCDFYENYSNKQIYIKQDLVFDDYETYLKDCFTLKNKYVSIWSKFCKKKVYEKIKFPTFSNAEDFFLHIQMFYYYYGKIVHFNRAFVHYNRINESSITYHNVSEKKIKELKAFNLEILEFFKKNDIYEKFIEYHYMGLLYRIVVVSGGKYKKYIKDICLEANKLKYIWNNYGLDLLKKIVVTFNFFNINMYAILKNIQGRA